MHDFNIGITDAHPLTEAPSPDNYRLCTHVEGIVETGATLYLTCTVVDMKGRYLVIQIPDDPATLSMCEVEVYGGKLALPLCTLMDTNRIRDYV